MPQMDSFDDLFRLWAWRPSEARPEEPQHEIELGTREGSPSLWVTANSGEASATFRWVHISSERSLPDPLSKSLSGDFNQDGVLGVADIEMLAAEIQAASDTPRFDLTGDQAVDAADLTELVTVQMNTWIGDANLDGAFDSTDLIEVFSAGEYDDGVAGNSNWATGDWTADGEFDSSDVIAAFTEGGYDQGPRGGVQAVPEPSSAAMLLLLGTLFVAARRHGIRH